MTGNNTTVQFTTHMPPPPGQTNTSSVTEDESYGFDPHQSLHEYAIEWEPNIVRWFIDGQLTHIQDGPWVTELFHPMEIYMNLWVASAESWVGVFDPSVLPVMSEYDFVKAYAYTPGNGTSGTGNNFTFLWEDHFDSFDSTRWSVSEFTGFQGNLSSFESTAVTFDDGKLKLELSAPSATPPSVPVTVSVDANAVNLNSSDALYLAGGFNSWCGNCHLMTEDNGVWTTTVNLPPGRHEYLFVKNLWEDTSAPEPNSPCDFKPCDQFYNYGVLVSHGSAPITKETVCWDSCSDCDTCPADIDGNGVITVNDFLNFNSMFGIACGACPEDIDGNGTVDINDFLDLNSAFGTVCPQ